ncbi:cuticle protein CP14.6-like [Bradysia coprophila]|uniref:cuticle protein CP14.6-like n=1 Tax=Bradysia coprophila TaxID=38358 RepID=UPI00187DA988|nr:cuticle protein CP14.6-like [Bradysia coprophila]
MVKIVVSLLVVALSGVFAAPAPQEDPSQIQVVRYENNNNDVGKYTYTYELSNGQIHSEAGALAEVGEGDEKVQVIVVSGSYTFVGPDGITYWVNYTADENGYHPVVGTGPGGIKGGDTASLDPSVFKSLVG